jgi:lysophospholipase L1-like esterase
MQIHDAHPRARALRHSGRGRGQYKLLPIACLALACAAPAAASVTFPQSGPVHLLVVAGQSNAVGNGTTSNGLDGTLWNGQADLPYRYWIRVSDPAATPHTSADQWQPLGIVTTGSTGNPYTHDTAAPIGGFGPEILIARTLADTPGAGPFAVVKVAAGGTEMGDAGDATGKNWWKVGGDLHARLRAEIDAALADLAARGLQPELSGLFWMQGESDARKDASVDRTANALAYADNLSDLIADLRAAYAAPDMPVVIGRVDPTLVWGMDFSANADIVRAAQMWVAENVEAAAWVNCDDLPRYNSTDTIHFNAAGQQRLGWRMAQAWLRIRARMGAELDVLHAAPFAGGSIRQQQADAEREAAVFGPAGWRGDMLADAGNPNPLRLRYQRASDTGRLADSLESSTNLASWSPATAWQTESVTPLDGGLEQVDCRYTGVLAGAPVFVRGAAVDTRQLGELSFGATRDLWLRMVRGWSGLLNAGGTGWSGTSYYFEGGTRMLWPLAAWLSRPDRPTAPEVDGAPVDIGAFTLNALRNGTDPAHTDRWPLTASSTNIYDQIIVEAPMAGLAAWLLHAGARAAADPSDPALPWNGLTAAHRSNINAFLAAMPDHGYVNNWNLFIALNNATREALADAGVAGFGGHSKAAIDNAMALVQRMHRGGGWYSDDTGYSVIDDYNSLVLLAYQMLNYILDPGRPESETVIPGSFGRGREAVLRDVAAWCATQAWFFDDGGAHPEFGRSTSYKFGRLVALVMAYHLEHYHNAVPGGWNYPFQIFPHDAISTGQLRRLVRLHLNLYLANETVDPDSFRLVHGQTRDSGVQVMEDYLQRSPASVHWAMKLFGALWLLGDDDPLWSVPEEPLATETTAFAHWFHAPGLLVHGGPDSGHIELINARNYKNLLNTYQINQYLNKYNKFAYSSRLGWATRGGTTLDQCVLVGAAYRAMPDGDLYLPAGWPVDQPGVVRSIEEIGVRRVSTLIFLKDGAQVRVHRVSGTAGYQLRDGAYALGRALGEAPVAQSGAGWRYVETSRGSVFLKALAGYDSVNLLDGDGNHSRDPAWTLPYANTASAGADPFHAAILTAGCTGPMDPEALAASVVSLVFEYSGARVTFSDGTGLWAPFIP